MLDEILKEDSSIILNKYKGVELKDDEVELLIMESIKNKNNEKKIKQIRK